MAFSDGIVLKLINVIVYAVNFGQYKPSSHGSVAGGGPHDLSTSLAPPSPISASAPHSDSR